MKINLTKVLACLLFLTFTSSVAVAQISVTPEEARAIAKEAYVYGFPIVDNYRVSYAYYTDKSDPNFKALWNQIANIARVFTPDDTAVQTPNSGTPYSWMGMDLRAEPIVLTVPAMEEDRYFSVQTIPGRGWSVLLRLYGPEKSWFDKTLRPGEFELVR